MAAKGSSGSRYHRRANGKNGKMMRRSPGDGSDVAGSGGGGKRDPAELCAGTGI